MKRSIRKEILFIIVGLVAGAIAICWILNYTMLEDVYISHKIDQMEDAYDIVSEAGANDALNSESFEETYENLTSSNNMRIIVLKPDMSNALSFVDSYDMLLPDYQDIIFGGESGKTIREKDSYRIARNEDKHRNKESLNLIGNISNGYSILIRTPIQSMHEAKNLACSFLLFAGIIVIILAWIIGTFLTRRITRPLLVLTDISRRMVNLDFEARYEKDAWKDPEWKKKHPPEKIKNPLKRTGLQVVDPDAEGVAGNEIDVLGDHMNRLSEQLEMTISELKSANATLQKDIEHKTQIDEMRKEFLSNVSHELKTPLALIQGYAEGLKECINDDAESRDFYCEVIMDEADKMNRMVKKLLTLNQLEFGNEQINMERFNMTELIRGVADSTQILRDQKDITLKMDLTDPEYVWGDEFKMEEVITNYMSNAVNHCDGEKQIRISYKKMPDHILRICVFNTGHNIPEEDLDKIWIKFYKVDKARTRAYGGSGIGLSIVKAIMDSMNQKCGVRNLPDGVEFWAELSQK